jgi:hypothetical protein
MRLAEEERAEAMCLAEKEKERAEAVRLAEEERAEAMRLAEEEKAEAMRLAEEERAEAIRFAEAEKAEAMRLAEEEREMVKTMRFAEEQAEGMRLAEEKAEAMRLVEVERAEAMRLAEEEAEAMRLAEERAEAMRLTEMEKERAKEMRFAKQKAEAMRLAEQERERANEASVKAKQIVAATGAQDDDEGDFDDALFFPNSQKRADLPPPPTTNISSTKASSALKEKSLSGEKAVLRRQSSLSRRSTVSEVRLRRSNPPPTSSRSSKTAKYQKERSLTLSSRKASTPSTKRSLSFSSRPTPRTAPRSTDPKLKKPLSGASAKAKARREAAAHAVTKENTPPRKSAVLKKLAPRQRASDNAKKTPPDGLARATRSEHKITRSTAQKFHSSPEKKLRMAKKESPLPHASRKARKISTVPKPPRLSTSERLGDKPCPNSRSVVSQKTKRSNETEPTKFIPRLTKPVPFTSQSIAKSVDKYILSRPATSPKAKMSTPTKYKPHVTQPVPFKSQSIARSINRYVATPAAKASPSLAESVDQIMRNGMRNLDVSENRTNEKLELTRPKPFKLSVAVSSKPPTKSSAQMEEEVMEHNRLNPFKARPISQGTGLLGISSVPKREVTTPKPFKLRSDRLTSSSCPSLSTEDIQALECKNQFKARRMPGRNMVQATLEPVHRRLYHIPSPNTQHQDPKTGASFKTSGKPKLSRPPRFVLSARACRRGEVTEQSRLNVIAREEEKKRIVELKKREECEIYKENRSPYGTSSREGITVPEPFQLESEARHQAAQLDIEHTRREEIEELNRMSTSFRANPPPTSRVAQKLSFSSAEYAYSAKELTQPEPFHLESISRHELSRKQMAEKIQQEEAEREEISKVRAIPLPKTTYRKQKLRREAPQTPIQPFSPALQSKSRAMQRKDFNAAASQRKKEELLSKERFEQQRQTELDAEIAELRRLPTKDGGLQFFAEPINAVFINRDNALA